jgi:sugar/nucleoside kinase (ribokinase family)
VAVSGHTIGDDTTGERLLAQIARFPNIDTRYLVRQTGLDSMYCRILVNPEGERAIIGVNVEGNPQTHLAPEDVARFRLVTLDLYGGEERVEIARMAHQAGLPVIVGDLRSTDHPVLPYTAVALASAAEIRREYPGWTADQFARRVQESGALQVVVTDGAHDTRVYDHDQPVAAITPPRVEVVDTTGAGDAFRAGIVYGCLHGWSLAETAALGVAAGSLSIQQPGACSRPAPLDEVRRLAQTLRRQVF